MLITHPLSVITNAHTLRTPQHEGLYRNGRRCGRRGRLRQHNVTCPHTLYFYYMYSVVDMALIWRGNHLTTPSQGYNRLLV